jgi:acyl-CoA synthetase (AMP-forming)/AMP-acid ligase II/acyl carrier protein
MFNATDFYAHKTLTVDYPDCETLVDILEGRASDELDKTAYTFLIDGENETVSTTYRQLDCYARAIASQLQSNNVLGTRVLLAYPPGLEFISAFFGCLYAGMTAVPTCPPRSNQPLSRLQSIAIDAQATTVLTTANLLLAMEQRISESLDLRELCWLATDEINDALAKKWQKPVIKNDTLALIQYTSGSTSTPKGVMISHGNLLHNLSLINECFQDTSMSIGVSWLPAYHDMGLIGGVLQPLYVGAPMTLISPVDFLQSPIRWLKAISRYQATTSGGPNFAYDLCLRKITPEQLHTLDLSSWTVAFNGAEPLRAETLEEFALTFAPCGFQKEAFHPCYGMAETTLIVSGGVKLKAPVMRDFQNEPLSRNQIVRSQPKEKDIRTLVSCGKNNLDQKIAIAQPHTFKACSSDEVGEIWVSGKSVAQGYWNQKLETEKNFGVYLADTKEGPFLRTGDLGFFHEGELFITGRLKDLIIIRGRNHYPQDIEQTVERSHPALRKNHGAAFSIDMDGQERLVIAQEIERTCLRNLIANEVVQEICHAVMQQHEIQPYAILLLKTGSIPKTSSGKIQRYACRSGFLDNSLNVVSDWVSNPRMKVNFRSLQEEIEVLENQVKPEINKQPEASIVVRENRPILSQRTETIQASLMLKVNDYLKTHYQDINEIEINRPLTDYGLDSLAAVELSGHMESWFGCNLSPDILYNCQTIEQLAHHLEALQMEKIFSRVEQLADDEVDILLQKLLQQEA